MEPSPTNIDRWEGYRLVRGGKGREWLAKYGWREGNPNMLRTIITLRKPPEENISGQLEIMRSGVMALISGHDRPGPEKRPPAGVHFVDLHGGGRKIGFGVIGYYYFPDPDGVWSLREIATGRVSFPDWFDSQRLLPPCGFVSCTGVNPETKFSSVRRIGLITPINNSNYQETFFFALRQAFEEANMAHPPRITSSSNKPDKFWD